MASASIQTRLKALEYPRWQSFNPSDKKEFRTLVVWLEEMKIRALDIPKRAPLRAVDSASWDAAFGEYLKELECPRQYSANMSGDPWLLSFLLSKAIGAEYADHSSLYNEVKKGGLVSGGSNILTGSPEQLRPQLEELAKALRIPIPPDVATNPTPLIQACKLRLTALKRVAEAERLDAKRKANAPATAASVVAAAGAKGQDEAAETKAVLTELDAFPLGFPVPDQNVRRAAALLRLGYLQDLRELQSLVNEVLAIAQEYTADPKTDARLGVVGR